MDSKKQRAPPPHPPPSSSSSSSGDEKEDESSSSSGPEEQTSIPQSKPDPPIQDQHPEDEEEESSSSSDQKEQAHVPQSKHDPPIQYQQSEDEEDEVSSSSSDQKEQTNIPQSKPVPPIQNQQSEGEEDQPLEDEEDEEENHLPVEPTTSKKPASKSEKKMVAPSKPANPHDTKPKGKSPIVRFWSVEDEITILQAMLHHQPPNNVGRIELNAQWVKELHDSIRKSLSVDADTAKLVEKMRRLRKKYIGASKRGDKLKLVTDKDRLIYSLSDKIWGKGEEEEEEAVGLKANGNSSAATASKGKSSKRKSSKRKSSKRDFPFIRDALGGGNKIALEMLEVADVNKAAALEKSFKKLRSVEISLMRKAYKLLR